MIKARTVRVEVLWTLLLFGSSACSLLAPSDAELIGGGHSGGAESGGGASLGGDPSASGGQRAATGGQPSVLGEPNGGSSPTSGGTAGSSMVDDPSGGTGTQAGSDGEGEPGAAGRSEASGGTEAAGGTLSGGATDIGSGGLNRGGKQGTGGHIIGNPDIDGDGGSKAGAGGAVNTGGLGTGSCANLSCPASAPCRVPEGGSVPVCYPSACAGAVGLCLAENADGSGAAIITEGRNADFNPLMGEDWRNRAKYFAYLDDAHGRYACVFPELSEQGTPLAIPLGEVRTKAAGFGQSNSWPNPPTCVYP